MKIIVIGAGASGLMAAANISAPVTVLERGEKAGKKIYITGKGRCNLTNDCGADGVLKNVVNGDKFLLGVLNRFPPASVMDFFSARGLNLKTERGGRVFPVSDKASDVTKTLVKAVEANGSEIIFNCLVNHIQALPHGFELYCEDGSKLFADIVVLAGGGKSYPSTGSDGKAYSLLKSLGHSVTELFPALAQLKFKTPVPELKGLSFKNVGATVYAENGQKKEKISKSGEILFTHTGVSGPVILTLSSYAARKNPTQISIDLKPQHSAEELDKKLLALLNINNTKSIKNVLPEMLPKSLAYYIIEAAGINGEKKSAEITKIQRQNIISAIKDLKFELDGVGGFSEAVITSGGASLAEFNPATMQSRLHENLYVVGEILDIDALTGGFNLQLAFSTALTAAYNINKRFVN